MPVPLLAYRVFIVTGILVHDSSVVLETFNLTREQRQSFTQHAIEERRSIFNKGDQHS